MKWTSWLALAALLSLGAFVAYTSFQACGVRCEVCIEFGSSRVCRAVDGTTGEVDRAAEPCVRHRGLGG